MSDRFEELFGLFLDGDASPAEFRELGDLLGDDLSLASLAADRLAEHRMLGVIHQGIDTDAAADAILNEVERSNQNQVNQIIGNLPPRDSTNSSWKILALASLAATVLIGIGWWHAQPTVVPSIGPVAPAIATVLLSEDCQWADGHQIAEGHRVGPGHLVLESGIALIRLDGGAEIALRHDTDLELVSPGKAKLIRGRVIVRAEDEAAGFRLSTPTTDLVDLGTEFSVGVDQAGATELDVLEGEVAVRSPSAHRTERSQISGQSKRENQRILSAGQSVRIAHPTAAPLRAKSKGERFSGTLNRAKRSSRFDLLSMYDGFAYDAGSLPLIQSKLGKGWKGPWRERTIEEGYQAAHDIGGALEIVHGQMNVTWPVPGGQSGMLKLPAGANYLVREMQHPIDLDHDGLYYFSLMIRQPDHTNRPKNKRPLEQIRLTFRSSEDFYGEALSFGISPRQNPRLQTGVGIGRISAGTSPLNQSTLWLGKILARGEGNDEVHFRVYGESEALSYAEPAVWDVSIRELDFSAGLDRVLLTSVGVAPRIIDELRIGPTWRSVAPIKSSPTTAPATIRRSAEAETR